jgi:hypothetical protein
MNPLCLTKETRTKPSVFSEVKRTTNLRMRFLPENLCLTSLESSVYKIQKDTALIRTYVQCLWELLVILWCPNVYGESCNRVRISVLCSLPLWARQFP